MTDAISVADIAGKPVCQLDTHGYYLCQTIADPDPMAADGGWLLPAGCVDAVPPPQQPDKVAWWNDGAKIWEYRPDYRGKTVYRTDDGSQVVIDRLGELPDGITAVPRPSDYHIWDDGQWQLPPAAAAQMLDDAKNSKLVDINASAQAFINAAAELDKVPDFEVQTWAQQAAEAEAWAADKTAVTKTLAAIAAARGIDLDDLRQKALKKARTYSALATAVAGQRQAYTDRLVAATDIDAVAAIDPQYQCEGVKA